jgi:hypothetical protein
MILVLALLLTIAVIVFTLFIRPQDLPAPEPVSPVKHLEERKARIYENLRDLQFEYRVGKLSDEDYQRTKLGLQAELAQTLAEIDEVLGKTPSQPPVPQITAKQPDPKPPEIIDLQTDTGGVWADPLQCPHCAARFDKPMKFCGACGKPMAEVDA